MVAADVHGKNQHKDGDFGDHVRSLKMRVADGRVLECSADQHEDLFRATIGGMGLTGHVLYEKLREAVRARGIDVITHAKCVGLHTDDAGAVVGVSLRRYDASKRLSAWHRRLGDTVRATKMGRLPGASLAQRALRTFEARAGYVHRAAARGGVVIAAGGFVFDEAMLHEHAPPYAGCMPLGTAGEIYYRYFGFMISVRTSVGLGVTVGFLLFGRKRVLCSRKSRFLVGVLRSRK